MKLPYILALIAAYLLVINLTAYASFYADKKFAQRNERRISERTLLTLALLGGTVGAITAQHQFRHKTRKQPFKSLLYSIATIQLVCAVFACDPKFRDGWLVLIEKAIAP